MLTENQILTGLKNLYNPSVSQSILKSALEYYSEFDGGEDEFISIIKKGISRGYAKEAAKLLRILTDDYSFPQLFRLLAEAYEKSSLFAEAAETYIKLLELAPRVIEYMLGAARNFMNSGEYSAAVKFYQEALKENGMNPLALYNLGVCYRQMENWENAEKYFSVYSQLNPDDANGIYNLGVIKEKQFDFEKAEEFYRLALKLNSALPDAHWNLALILLKKRNYAEGWAEFEWRKKMPFYKKNNLRINEWRGEDLKNKNFLIYSEQGFGDVIQFARFADQARKRFPSKVTAFVPQEIKRLLRSSNLFDFVASDSAEIEPEKYDYKVSFLSLPYFTGAGADEIKLESKLFEIETLKTFDDNGAINIGLVWKGNPEHENSKFRDINLSDLLNAIGNNNKIKLHSLHVGEITEEEKRLLARFNVVNHAAEISDFYDSAKIIGSLNVVISVDTAVLHLSGSMMKETWALIPFNNDWRWGENESVSEWYPTVKIFKQEKLGDWSAPLKRIKEKLVLLTDGKLSENERATLESRGAFFLNNGELNKAVRIFTEVAESFNDARAFNNLGIVHMQSGKGEEALNDFQTAIKLDENYFAAYKNLTALLIERGRFDDALKMTEKAIAVFGETNELIYTKAVIYHKLKKLDEAFSHYSRIYSLYREKEYLLDFSSLLIESEKLELAGKVLKENRGILVNEKRYYFLHGNLMKAEEDFEAAAASYKEALLIDPSYLDAKMNLASVMFLMRQISAAEKIYLELLRTGTHSNLFYNLGIIKQEKKEYDESLRYFNLAIELEPKAEYYFAAAEIFLTLKNFNQGLPLYEKRLEFMNIAHRPNLPDSWESMKGKRILVFEEQGIGDTFQFIRFIPLLRETAHSVTLAVRHRMKSFWEQTSIADDVSALDEVNAGGFDFAVPIVSLFNLWYQSSMSIPKREKYLHLGKDEAESINGARKKIAIAWRGNPVPVYHRKRHMELKRMVPLFRNTDADFYILQNELKKEEREILNENSNLFFLPDVVGDWNKLTDLIMESDLVLSVDTVYAHLAGALGKETFVMLPFSSDWRWGTDDKYSYWYERVKLFRQNSIDDWSGVINEILLNLNSN